MKKIYVAFIVALLVMFTGGFFVGRIVYHQPSKELCIGVPVAHNPGTFNFDEKMCLTNLDPEDEITIDNLQILIAKATEIEDLSAPTELPHYMIQLRSFNFGIFHIMAQVWMLDEGAIIGDWNYETNTITHARQLSEDSVTYLLEVIDGIKNK